MNTYGFCSSLDQSALFAHSAEPSNHFPSNLPGSQNPIPHANISQTEDGVITSLRKMYIRM